MIHPKIKDSLESIETWSYGKVQQVIEWLDEIDYAEYKANKQAERSVR